MNILRYIVLHLCITQIPGEYRINCITLLIHSNLRVIHPIQKQYQPKQTGSYGQLPDNYIFQKSDNVVAIPDNFSGDLKELDEKVNSMMEKIENSLPTKHRCKVWGKEGMRNDLRKHIEANHLEGVCIPCNSCERTFRSRNSLREHNLRHHK